MLGLATPVFALLALAAGLVWFLHSRRQYRQIVPSLVIWRQLRGQAGRQTRSRRVPLITPSLLLQLLAVALLAAALVQPFWGRGDVPDHLIVMVDTNAAMGQGGDTAVFEQVRRDLVAELTQRWGQTPSRLSVIGGGPYPSYAAARWQWSDGRVAEALERVSSADGDTHWDEAARLISAILRPGEASEILVVGTSAAPDSLAEHFPDLKVSGQLVDVPLRPIGLSARLVSAEAGSNLWTLEGEALGSEDGKYDLAVQYATAVDRTPLDWATLELTLAADTPKTFSLALDLPGPGLVTASLTSDANPDGNRLRFVAEPEPETLDILYVGAGEQVLLRAFHGLPGVRIFQDTRLDEAANDFSLVILDRVDSTELPATNIITVEAVGESLGAVDPDYWADDHPIMRDIGWSSIDISAASGLTPRADETVLLAANDVVLITAASTSNGRRVRIGFDPAASNWPELSAFPVFVSNITAWMGANPGAVRPANCTIGLPCQVDARLVGQSLMRLDATDTAPEVVPDGQFIPQRIGLFRGGGDALSTLIAVNPPATSLANTVTLPALALELPTGLAPWLIGLGLVVLLIEAGVSGWKRGRLPRISLLRLATLALVVAALVNLPLPWLQRGTEVVVIAATALDEEGAPSGSSAFGSVLAGPAPVIAADLGQGARAEASLLRVTNADKTLDLARAMLPPGREGNIVLAGDIGRDAALERRLAAEEVVIHHLPVPALGPDETYVDLLEVPRIVLRGEAPVLTALVHSGSAQTVTLEVVADGEIIASQDMELVPGQNRIEAVLPKVESAEVLVEIRVLGTDAHPQNDALSHSLTAAPVRPIAIIAGEASHGEAFAQLLSEQGLEVQLLAPARVPYRAKDWLGYGGIVLVDTPAVALATSQQTLIESMVAEHGMGLVILGGQNSFGPGGYFGTPLEALSPFSSRVPQDAPEVAMVFVLDRSGSMQQAVGSASRLDVAKMATVAATELLNPQSRVGIIAFDAEAHTLLPLTRLEGSPGAVQRALSGFDPGGGTDILPGLVEAVGMLSGVEAAAKHVVVMTDGLSQPTDYTEVVGKLRDLGATVSSVAIGRGADASAARTIAALGGGSAHISADFAALPAILSQEAMLLSSPVEEGEFQPVWHSRSDAFLSALPAQLPPLFGFVGTTAKPEANLVATTTDSKGRDMPVLGWWRYGNGLVLSLTTDATGPWSEDWQRLPHYGALFKDVLLQFQPTTPRPGLTLSTQSDGDYLELRVVALDAEALPLTGQNFTAMAETPDKAEVTVSLLEQRPGYYVGRYRLEATGRYALSIAQDDKTEPVRTAYYHSYPPRYDFARSGGAAALAAATGGQQISAAELSALGAMQVLGWHHQWPIWCLLAFGLFLIDLTIRYLGLPARRRAKAKSAAPGAVRQEGIS